jgi:restriction endonuclease Mrr
MQLKWSESRATVASTGSLKKIDWVSRAYMSRQTIVLIDGPQLADFMVEFGVGVSDVETIKLEEAG